ETQEFVVNVQEVQDRRKETLALFANTLNPNASSVRALKAAEAPKHTNLLMPGPSTATIGVGDLGTPLPSERARLQLGAGGHKTRREVLPALPGGTEGSGKGAADGANVGLMLPGKVSRAYTDLVTKGVTVVRPKNTRLPKGYAAEQRARVLQAERDRVRRKQGGVLSADEARDNALVSRAERGREEREGEGDGHVVSVSGTKLLGTYLPQARPASEVVVGSLGRQRREGGRGDGTALGGHSALAGSVRGGMSTRRGGSSTSMPSQYINTPSNPNGRLLSAQLTPSVLRLIERRKGKR
ncbi:hypothetical protein KIPB_011838, partial [Kipferlia bialata]